MENCWQLIPHVHKTVILDRYRLPSLGITPSKPLVSDPVGENLFQTGPLSCVASRGSPNSRFVLPNTPAPNPLLSCHATSIPTPSCAEPTPGSLTFIAEPQPTINASLLDPNIRIARHFKKIIPGAIPGRIQRLVRVVRGFVEAQALSLESYGTLWSAKNGIFDGFENGPSRFCRLQRGRRRIILGTAEYDCAARLALMFVNHDIDHLSQVPKNSKHLGLSRG